MTSTKPVLAVDFDDVVNNFNHAFLFYNRAVHDAKQHYNDLCTYEYEIDYGISEEEAHARIWHFCHELHTQVLPIKKTIRGLWVLQRHFDIHMVTGRCESIASVTHDWLDTHAPRLFVDTHFTNSFATKHPERRRSKVEVCREIGAVALVDDALHHVGDVAKQLHIPVFMPTRPWNKNTTPTGVTRVSDFDEALVHLITLAA